VEGFEAKVPAFVEPTVRYHSGSTRILNGRSRLLCNSLRRAVSLGRSPPKR